MIRGKIKCNREVRPQLARFGGPSPFIEINGQWVLASDHSKKAKVVSFAEFFDLEKRSTDRASHNED